ncbi:MAG TPA: hypothetical protein VJT73_13605 [Polyangiaceae bacterium]|nr:hypothetical protein [Polyangiaceae bacterium]
MPPLGKFVIHEREFPEGGLETTELEVADGRLWLSIDPAGSRVDVPLVWLDAVMKRYGRPLEDGLAVRGPELSPGDGRRLVLFRYKAGYDVIAKDYVLYERPGEEPVAALATAVTAALGYLLRSGD